MGTYIFIILSTLNALYAAYLLTCCLYKTDYMGEPADKVVFPRIVYFLVFIAAFVPMVNLICVVLFLVWLWMCREEYRVKSWLFEKPEEKDASTGSAASENK